MIRILLADNYPIVRLGMRRLLEDHAGWEVCGEAENVREAVALAEKFRPHIAILDPSMAKANGIEAAHRIRMASPETRILIFSMHESEQMVQCVLNAGAQGYLLKTEAAQQLVIAVEALLNDQPYVTGPLADFILRTLLHPKSDKNNEGWMSLTDRELDVLRLVALGRSSKQIAAILSIHVKTVESHRGSIARKLGVHTAIEMVHYAVRNRLIRI